MAFARATMSAALLAGLLAAAPAPAPGQTVDALVAAAGEAREQGDLDSAERLFRRALETAEATSGPDHPDAMVPAVQLGNVHLARDRFDLAEPLLLRALAIGEAALGPDHERTLTLLNGIATVYAEQADHERAEELLLRAAPRAERALGGDHPLTLRILNNIAVIRMTAGRFLEAEAAFERVLAARARALGEEHPETLTSRRDLATLHVVQGRLAEAEPLFESVLAARQRLLGPGHPSTLESLADLGQLRMSQGRFAEAERLHEQASAGYLQALGPDHPDTLVALNYLGKAQIELGRYDRAEPLFARLADQAAATFGAEHPTALLVLSNLAAVYNAQGRLAEAEPLLRRSLAGLERVYGPHHFEVLQARSNLGMLLIQQGRLAEAEPLLLSAAEGADRAFGPSNSETLLFVSNVATLYEAQDRFPEALALLERAVAAAERALGPDHPQTLLFASNLGLLEQRTGGAERAEALFRRVLAARERLLGAGHRDTLLAAANLGTLHALQGRAEGEPLLRRVLDDSIRRLGESHPDTARTRFNLAHLLTAAGRPDQAEPLFERSLGTYREALGDQHPDTIAAAAMLAAVRMAVPRRQAEALAPARLFAAGSRARRAPADSGRYAEAQARRETGLADGFLLLADALWSTAQRGEPDQDAAAEAFLALQDAAAGPTDRAVMQMTVRRLADRSEEGLGALVRERDGLERQWTATSELYAESLAATGGDAELERQALRRARADLEARLGAIDDRLRSEFPQFHSLVRPESLPLDQARAMLARDEALLLVVPGFRGTHVFAVTREGSRWVRSPWTRDEVNSAVRRLLWDVGANVAASEAEAAEWAAAGGPGYPYDRATAHALFNAIVAPVVPLIEGKSHLFVAAAGSLTSFPFGILVAAPPEGADGDPAALRSTAWFADAHALVQLPSVQALHFLRRFGREADAGPAPDGFLGFGDPLLLGAAVQRGSGNSASGAVAARDVFAGARAASGAPLADVRQLRRLARLPGTATELEAMRAALDAPPESVFLGDRATESELRRADLTGVRILAFATHGLTAGEIRTAAEPGLVFTPPDAAGETDDGFLTASEVAALRLDAEWVILSACNTAAGDGSEGAPGLSGLARSFFYAGARNLLASHWPVRDDVAARLTVRTIEIARDDPRLSRAEALQRAMREIREERAQDGPEDSWAHPNAWAPFVLIGDAGRGG